MTGQDVAALAVCAAALAWLVRRLVTAGRSAAGPTVTTSALVRRTRSRAAERRERDAADAEAGRPR